MRVAVVAEWYPSPADPVLGVWAHRQALAARAAGAEIRVLALRRPVPPLALARDLARGRAGWRDLAAWAHGARAALEPSELDGIPVEPVPFLAPPRPVSYGTWGHWSAPPLARALSRLRARWPYDAVHAHSIVPPGYAVSRWRARSAPPRPALVVSTHGPDIIHVAHGSTVARRASVHALRAADLVMANSTWAARACAALAGPELPTRVVHLGAEVPAHPAAHHPRPTLVTVAHLVARKRHAVVLHALARLPPALRPDYVVIGDGPGRDPLERTAHALGIAPWVRFLGQLPHAETLAEAARCHLFVMPGVEEPFGVAFVEAMAAGLPAIGARGQGGPEDIAAAGPGMELVAPDDHVALAEAIGGLLRDPDRRARLGAAARRTVAEHFTWAHCGEATLAAYAAACGRS